MTEIVLGLDLGTQFCYMGYLKVNQEEGKLKFVPAFDSVNMPLGIPSTIAVRVRDENRYELVAGSSAEQEVEKNMAKPTEKPIKEFIRDQANCLDSKIEICKDYSQAKFSVIELVTTWIRDLYGTISTSLKRSFGNDYKIIQVNFACPNLSASNINTTETYIDLIGRTLKNVFGDKCVVNVQLESNLGASLVNKVFDHEIYSVYDDVITIDIGAGTTDIAVFTRSEDNENKIKPTTSVYFGGRDIDRLLSYEVEKVIPKLNFTSIMQNSVELCKYKKWLFHSVNDNEYNSITGIIDSIRNRESQLREGIKDDISIVGGVADHWDNFRHAIRSVISKYSDKNVLVLLLGGTSRIPFIKDEIQRQLRGHIGAGEFTIKYLTDDCVTEKFGITDANFIAYAAAYINHIRAAIDEAPKGKDLGPKEPDKTDPGEKPEKPKRVVEMVAGAPFVYVIKVTDGSYHIIADTRPDGNKKYFLTSKAYHAVTEADKTVCKEFCPNELIYSIYMEDPLPEGTTKLIPRAGYPNQYRCNDENGTVIKAKTAPQQITSYLGVKKAIVNNNHYYGTCYDYNLETSLDKRLQVTIYYNDANRTAIYGDIPEEDRFTYEEMQKLSQGVQESEILNQRTKTKRIHKQEIDTDEVKAKQHDSRDNNSQNKGDTSKSFASHELYDKSEFIIQDGVLQKYIGKGGQVKIPNCVTNISDFAFYDCGNLTSITISINVEYIGKDAFKNCKNLKSAIFENSCGWKRSKNVDMSHARGVTIGTPKHNARLLTKIFSSRYYWKRDN